MNQITTATAPRIVARIYQNGTIDTSAGFYGAEMSFAAIYGTLYDESTNRMWASSSNTSSTNSLRTFTVGQVNGSVAIGSGYIFRALNGGFWSGAYNASTSSLYGSMSGTSPQNLLSTYRQGVSVWQVNGVSTLPTSGTSATLANVMTNVSLEVHNTNVGGFVFQSATELWTADCECPFQRARAIYRYI